MGKTTSNVVFTKLKYKILYRNVMGKEKAKGGHDSAIRVFGYDSNIKKYIPLGTWSLELVIAFLGIIEDGDPKGHPDYNKVIELVDPHKSRDVELKGDILDGASEDVTKSSFLTFLRKYNPSSRQLQILNEEK
tara:strand:- start:206 stop:604 length:399 start_codon:yes stop_codon:yes gene_type:complete